MYLKNLSKNLILLMKIIIPTGVSNDFQVLQASTQGPSSNQPGGNLLNVSQDNIPLVNNMLNCMQQSIGGGSISSIPNVNPGAGHPALHHHHHHHHHHNVIKNLVKIQQEQVFHHVAIFSKWMRLLTRLQKLEKNTKLLFRMHVNP